MKAASLFAKTSENDVKAHHTTGPRKGPSIFMGYLMADKEPVAAAAPVPKLKAKKAVAPVDDAIHHAELVDKALAYLAKTHNESGDDEFYYGAVKKDGKISASDCIVCHAGLGRLAAPEVLWTFAPPCNPPVNKDMHIAYYDWLMNESPWKNVAFPVEAEFAVMKGFVIPNLELPSNLIANFCIATRVPNEYPEIIDRWFKFKALGINPSLGMVFATCLNDKDHDNKAYWTRQDSSHIPIESDDLTRGWVDNFTLGKLSDVHTLPSYKTHHRYYPCNKIWEPKDRGPRYDEYLYDTYINKATPSKRMFKVEREARYDRIETTWSQWLEIMEAEQKRITNGQAAAA